MEVSLIQALSKLVDKPPSLIYEVSVTSNEILAGVDSESQPNQWSDVVALSPFTVI